MKKLVYILSIAIGLFMTGCAQWEKYESLPSDTWGAVPELAVYIDSTCLDETGNLTKDYLPLHIDTKHATHMGYAVSLEPVADMDYTALLQGMYDNYVAEVDSAGSTFSRQLTGVKPGNTYYIYAVAANAAGVQATAAVAVGAVDVDAPQPLTNPELKATQGGKRAVIAFNENIIRDENMGAITYTIYNIDTNELVEEGTVADATAAGANLTVTLPETVVYDENTNYIVVLSFAEGAVTDLYGNKMAAINGVYNVDDMQVENGYWWLVEPVGGGGGSLDEFFAEGTYAFDAILTFDGKEWLQGLIPFTLAHVSDDYDMGNIFENAPFTGTRWEINGILGALLEGATDQAFPAFSYEYVDSRDGLNYEYMTMVDPENGWYPCCGTVTLQGQTYEVFLADKEGQSVSPYWDFVLLDENDNPEGKVEDLKGYYALSTPIFMIEVNGQAGLLVQFDTLIITRDGQVQAGAAKVYEEPLMLENVKINMPTDRIEKTISFKK